MGFFLTDLIAGQQAADADNRAGDFASKIATINQGLDKQRAQVALAQGNYLAGQARMRGSQVVGAQKSAYAASGVDIGSGSAVSAGLSSSAMAEMDAQIASNNAAREAWGYKTQALQDKWQGQLTAWGDYDKAQSTLASAGIQASGDFASMFTGLGSKMGGSGGGGVSI